MPADQVRLRITLDEATKLPSLTIGEKPAVQATVEKDREGKITGYTIDVPSAYLSPSLTREEPAKPSAAPSGVTEPARPSGAPAGVTELISITSSMTSSACASACSCSG
jgi:hypothetical protein